MTHPEQLAVECLKAFLRSAPDNASRERRIIAIQNELAKTMAEEHVAVPLPPRRRPGSSGAPESQQGGMFSNLSAIGVGDPTLRVHKRSRAKTRRAAGKLHEPGYRPEEREEIGEDAED